MADTVNDFYFALSGNVTYSDGSKSVIEYYYDSKAGGYSPSSAESLATDAQLANSPTAPSDYIPGAAANWFTQLQWFLQNTVEPFTGAVPIRTGADPAEPVPLKNVTDMVLHFRGVVAFEDGDWSPIVGEYSKRRGGSSRIIPSALFNDFVWQTDNEYTALIEQALNTALFNVELA